MVRARAAAALVALLAAAAAACAHPGGASGPSIGDAVSPPIDAETVPAAAGDGSLWYVHGAELVRVDPLDRGTRRFSMGVAAPQQVRVVRSAGDAVWFVAIAIPSPGAVTTVVGRAGPHGIVSRMRLPADDTVDPGAVGAAGDGALWAHEIRAPSSGGRVDGVLRIGVDGGVSRVSGFIAGAIVPGADGTVWVATQGSVVHAGRSGALATWPLPSFPALVPRPDGSVGIAVQARGRDACLVGSATDAGLDLDAGRPLIDNTGRPALYSGTYGCFETYAGGGGTLWDVVRPEQYGHGGALTTGPWDVYRVDPDGARRHWTLPSGDWVAAMAAGPGGAMWFVSGGGGALGVITASGAVEEHLAGAPDPHGATPRLVSGGGPTMYLVTGTAVHVVHVPPR